MARDGGTLVRAGHTEASVDIARLAGLIPAGVICEIINDDGTMARLPELVAFAQRHNIKLGTIADLIAYRRTNERLVKRTEERLITGPSGSDWRLLAFESLVDGVEHLAMARGDISGARAGVGAYACGRCRLRHSQQRASDKSARRDGNDQAGGTGRGRADP